jgi:NADPH:quinone reductase-like Zn-dependent oxidoreductase
VTWREPYRLVSPRERGRRDRYAARVRAVVIDDGRLRVSERPDPVPGPGDVVVAVRSAGINAADLLQRRGLYPAPPGWPADVPGLELAGVVASLGEGVDRVRVGQRVCAVVGGGAQATHCVVPAEHLLAVPDSVDLLDAGGFAEAFTTAHDALDNARCAPGERVLVSGAAGGVGTAAIQLARLRGAHPIAVTRDARHHRALGELGAAETLTVDEVAGLAPVDVVIELVGAAHLSHALGVLAPRARVVVIGVGGGGRVELDLLRLMATRASVTGSTLRARSRAEKAAVAAALAADTLGPWAAGELTVPVAARYRLDDVETAYEQFAAAGKLGKFVLDVR